MHGMSGKKHSHAQDEFKGDKRNHVGSGVSTGRRRRYGRVNSLMLIQRIGRIIQNQKYTYNGDLRKLQRNGIN